jgi:hypothetical protein
LNDLALQQIVPWLSLILPPIINNILLNYNDNLKSSIISCSVATTGLV